MSSMLLLLLSLLLTSALADPKMELDVTSGIIPGVGSHVASVYGGFVVAWVSDKDVDVRQYIYLQAYRTDGSRIGESVLVCEVRAQTTIPEICGGEESNRFMIAFEYDYEIYRVDALLFDFGIELLSPPCPINTDLGGRRIIHHIRLACSPDATIFAMASSRYEGLDTSGIFLRIYDGEDISAEPEPIHVSTHLFGVQSNPDITILDDYSIMIVWQDIHGSGIYSIRYSTDGYPLGRTTKMNNVTAISVSDPTVASLSTGYVVGWKEKAGYSFPAVVGGLIYFTRSYLQIYSNNGTSIGDPFLVSSNEAAAGNVLSVIGCGDDTMWAGYAADGKVHAKHFDLSGNQIQQEITIHGHVTIGHQHLRIGLASHKATGVIVTFGTGQRMPIATYWWAGSDYGQLYDLPENTIPESNFSNDFRANVTNANDEDVPLMPWNPPVDPST